MAQEQDKERAQPVAWSYVPSKVFGDVVLTADPVRAEDARTAGFVVTPLYAAPQPNAAQPASQRDELLQVALDFIGTLTGMEPPPIEVAPPEVFAPFYAFVDRVQAITRQPNAALADGWLNPEDMAALQRVDGMFQDGEGYDVPAPQMKRLAALGVLRHHSAGRYSITTFGQVVLGVECFRKPLETVDECNARLGREHRAKLGMPAPPTLNASKEGSHG